MQCLSINSNICKLEAGIGGQVPQDPLSLYRALLEALSCDWDDLCFIWWSLRDCCSIRCLFSLEVGLTGGHNDPLY